MISKTLINKIKGPLLAIEENLEKSVKNIDDFVVSPTFFICPSLFLNYLYHSN